MWRLANLLCNLALVHAQLYFSVCSWLIAIPCRLVPYLLSLVVVTAAHPLRNSRMHNRIFDAIFYPLLTAASISLSDGLNKPITALAIGVAKFFSLHCECIEFYHAHLH